MAQDNKELIIDHINLNGSSYRIADTKLESEVEEVHGEYEKILDKLNSYNFDTEVVVITESQYNEIEHKENVFYFLYEDDEEDDDPGSGGDNPPVDPDKPVTPPTFNGMLLEINAPYDSSIWGAVFTDMTNITYNNWQLTIN